ncbi:MAG: SH3 domain-containing protein [Synergistaceae bacterium]|jgi:hypothetical protein|nr:SH3 domain-containing protein [Synergistaceae bacterium]
MRRLLFAVLFFSCASAFTNASEADQAALVSRNEAERASVVLKAQIDIRNFCEPCGDAPPEAEIVSRVSVSDEGEDYWSVSVNGEGVDLAYIYVYDGTGRWVNLARKLGINVTGVSESFTEERMSAIVLGYFVNIRETPGLQGRVKFQVQYGDVLAVTGPPLYAPDGTWYSVVAEGDKPPSRSYVSAEYIAISSVGTDDEEAVGRIAGTSLKEALSGPVDARDISRKSQGMTMLTGLPWFATIEKDQDAPLYNSPDENSGTSMTLTEEEYVRILGWSEGGPSSGWYLAMTGPGDAGWIKAKQLHVRGNFYNSTPGEKALAFIGRAVLNLGSGEEAEKKWGPSASVKREESDDGNGYHWTRKISDFGDIVIDDTADGNGNDLGGNFRFSRKGSSIGGLAIGEKWCDVNYMERALGLPDNLARDERGNSVMEYLPGADALKLTIDKAGLLSEIYYEWVVYD